MKMTEKGRLYLNFAGYLAVIVAGALLGVGCGKPSDDDMETVPSNMPSVLEFWATETTHWAQKAPAIATRIDPEAVDVAAYEVSGKAELGRLAEAGCEVTWTGEGFSCPNLGITSCPRNVAVVLPDNAHFRIPPAFVPGVVASVDGPELICTYTLNVDTVWARLSE
jgi:hypothetical protein